jgi:hypothetical protein
VRPEVTDPDSDKLTLSILDRSTSGSASVDGTTVRYTPASGVTGVDSVVVVGSDGRAESTPVRLTITVQPPGCTAGDWDRAGDDQGRSQRQDHARRHRRGRPGHLQHPHAGDGAVPAGAREAGTRGWEHGALYAQAGVQETDGFVYQVTDSAG